MKIKKMLSILLTLTVIVSLSGCGGSGDSNTNQDAAPETAPTQTEAPAPAPETETEETLDPITPSDYLIDASEYVTVGDLEHLTATQTDYSITDEMVRSRIDDELYSFAEETEIDEAAAGSIVYAEVVSSIQGDPDSEYEESTYFNIGDEDYGAEFDEQLLGTKAGDELSFSVTYDDSAWVEDWAGHTVDFKVTIDGVYELNVPEYDDAFISDYTDCSTKDEYEASIRETLESEYSEESYSETVSDLFQSVMDESTFSGYPEELYDFCEEETLSFYTQFTGDDDVSAVLDIFGITQEDLDADILNSVNTRLLVSAISKAQGIEVTEQEYIDEVTSEAEMYGYLSPAEFEADNSRESLVWMLYENKVADYLYSIADITTIEGSVAEDFGEDFEEDFEEDELMTEPETDYTPAEIAENSLDES